MHPKAASLGFTLGNDDGDGPAGPRQLWEVAFEAGPFLHHRPRWTHRRVHHISFPDNGMVRTQISTDFTVRPDYPVYDSLADGRKVYFVPLIGLRKWPPLLHLDLRDAEGQTIPLLTSTKNEEVDAAFLLGSAPEGSARDAVEHLLCKIPRAEDEQEGLNVLNEAYAALAPFVREFIKEESEQWAETLRLGATLASNRLFWARVQVRPGERTIVKVAYELPPDTFVGPEESRGPSLLWRALASLSYSPLRLPYRWHDMSGCASYHVHVDMPEGLEVHRAALRMTNLAELNRADKAPVGEPHGLENFWWSLTNTLKVRWRDMRHPRGRYEVPLARPKPGVPHRQLADSGVYFYIKPDRQMNVGVATFDLVTSRDGLRRSAVGFGAATTAFLAAMAAIATGVAQHLDAAIPALLLTPAILAFVVVNPGEHRLVRRQLFGVRAVVAGIAVLPVAAAVSLLSFGTPPDVQVLRWCWITIAALSLLLTILLGLSWLLPPVKDPADPRDDDHKPAGVRAPADSADGATQTADAD